MTPAFFCFSCFSMKELDKKLDKSTFFCILSYMNKPSDDFWKRFDVCMKYVSIVLIFGLYIIIFGKIADEKLDKYVASYVASAPVHEEWIKPFYSEEFLKEERLVVTISAYIHDTYHKSKRFSDKVSRIIVRESVFNGIDPVVVASLIGAESSYRPNVKSYVGAIGLMQVMPFWKTYKDIEIYGNRKGDLRDPEVNIMYGVAILKKYLKQKGGNINKALAAYNGTAGKMKYPNKIKRHFSQIEKYLDADFVIMHNAEKVFSEVSL